MGSYLGSEGPKNNNKSPKIVSFHIFCALEPYHPYIELNFSLVHTWQKWLIYHWDITLFRHPCQWLFERFKHKNIWTYLPICQVPSHLLFSFALVRLQSMHSEHIQSNQCHQETKSINIVLIVQYLLLFEELGRLLGRALIIGWRKNSWNPERVPSVVTFLCVCVSVRVFAGYRAHLLT